jgi:hypothetical protein
MDLSKNAMKRAAKRAEKLERRAEHQRCAAGTSDDISFTPPPSAATPPPPPAATTTAAALCAFVVPHKNRHCKRTVVLGQQYCGNHLHLDSASTVARIRIPCPIDPSHTAYEDIMHKHIKVCETAKRWAVMAAQMEAESLAQPYYSLYHNSITPPPTTTSTTAVVVGGGKVTKEASSSGASAASGHAEFPATVAATAAAAAAAAKTGYATLSGDDPRPSMGAEALRWLRAAVVARDTHFGSQVFPSFPAAQAYIAANTNVANGGVDGGSSGGGGGGGESGWRRCSGWRTLL